MVLEILMETKLLLSADLPLLLFFTLLLIFPVSAITLSQVLINRTIAQNIKQLLLFFSSQPPKAGGPTVSLLEAVAEAIATEAMAAPAALTLMMAAKVGVWMVVRRRREGMGGTLALEEAAEEGCVMWARMCYTYLCGVAVAALAAVAWLNLVSVGTNHLEPSSVARFLIDSISVALFLGFLPLLVVALRLSISTSALHPSLSLYGPSAISASFSLLLRHGYDLFLALFLFSLPSSASLATEIAFYSLVVRHPSLASLALAPLLIFLHSLVQLVDVILCYSFFTACYEDGDFCDGHSQQPLEEEEEEEDEEGGGGGAVHVDKPATLTP